MAGQPITLSLTVVLSLFVAGGGILAPLAHGAAGGHPDDALRSDQVRSYAATTFRLADLNQDDRIDRAEYVLAKVGQAENVWQRGQLLVPLDGDAVLPISLGRAHSSSLPSELRRDFTALAETEFDMLSPRAEPVSEVLWTHGELGRFSAADRDADGILRGDELGDFVQVSSLQSR